MKDRGDERRRKKRRQSQGLQGHGPASPNPAAHWVNRFPSQPLRPSGRTPPRRSLWPNIFARLALGALDEFSCPRLLRGSPAPTPTPASAGLQHPRLSPRLSPVPVLACHTLSPRPLASLELRRPSFGPAPIPLLPTMTRTSSCPTALTLACIFAFFVSQVSAQVFNCVGYVAFEFSCGTGGPQASDREATNVRRRKVTFFPLQRLRLRRKSGKTSSSYRTEETDGYFRSRSGGAPRR